eukprot:3221853-Prymnesium_polylepis.2
MSVSLGIPVALTNSTIGVATGTRSEALVGHFDAAADLQTVAYEAAAKIGLNAVMMSLTLPLLSNGDPVAGVSFCMGLLLSVESQLRCERDAPKS